MPALIGACTFGCIAARAPARVCLVPPHRASPPATPRWKFAIALTELPSAPPRPAERPRPRLLPPRSRHQRSGGSFLSRTFVRQTSPDAVPFTHQTFRLTNQHPTQLILRADRGRCAYAEPLPATDHHRLNRGRRRNLPYSGDSHPGERARPRFEPRGARVFEGQARTPREVLVH